MRLIKRLSRLQVLRRIAAHSIVLYLRFVHATIRFETRRPAACDDLVAASRPFIACFWHGRMMTMCAARPPDYHFHMMISEHRDGVLIARAVGALGVDLLAASSKGGALPTMRALQQVLAQGHSVGITPDGSRGPRMRAKPGAIKAAQLTGAPVVPVSGATSRRRILGSWDRLLLPLPFSRGLFIWGEPIEVPMEADSKEIERLRAQLENELNRLTAEADRHFGLPEVAPAEAHYSDAPKRHARA